MKLQSEVLLALEPMQVILCRVRDEGGPHTH